MLTTYTIRHYDGDEILSFMSNEDATDFLEEFDPPRNGSWFYQVPYYDEYVGPERTISHAEFAFANVLYEHGDCCGGEQIYIDFDGGF